MNVHEIPIEALKPYTNNAKKHSEKQIEQLMKSIDLTKGLRQPIVIDSNNVVVCGHGRLEAAKRLGYITVPCECIDDMTEDEIKMYRILDNRSASIEYDLEIEMGELMDIEFDVSEYDMDISQLEYDIAEQQEKHQQYKEDTQHDVLNIVNLEKGQFLGEGLYDIPILEPVTELPPIREWISFNYVLSDKDPEGKAVHFFIDDYQFERVWNNPEKYLDKLKQYVCVATPDFSPYGDMPHALQIYNHYRKHWVGAWLQKHGVTVIPTIRCSTDERSFAWYLDGEPKNGIVIISSMWTGDENTVDISKREYQTMKKVLKPKKIFIYGKDTGNMGITKKDNVEFIKNFTQKRWDKNG